MTYLKEKLNALIVKAICFLVFVNLSSVMAEEYTWTGKVDGVSLFNEGNWKKDGTSPATGTIDPSVPLQFDLRVTSGTVGGSGFAPHLFLGGHALTVTGGSVVGNASKQAGIKTDSEASSQSTLNISGDGKVSAEFIQNVNITLSDNAQLQLYKFDNALNNSTISIAADFKGRIVISGGNETNVLSSIIPIITINDENAVVGTNIYISSTNDKVEIFTQKSAWDETPTGNKDYSDTPKHNDGPNIIFILLDDAGYGDIGTLWQNQRGAGKKKIVTPAIDKMAAEGCVMTNHYCGAPVCAPSRSSLLEGLHQGHASVRNNQFDKPIDDELSIAGLLKSAGYRTMHIGKNGLAGPRGDLQNLPAHPLKRGFDQFFGYLFHNQGHIHYPLNGTTAKEAFFSDGYREIRVGTELTYTTDVFTAKAKQWIETQQIERPEQPFFMYLAYDVPHSELQAATQPYPAGFGKDSGLQWTGYEDYEKGLIETPWVNTASGTADSYIPEIYQQSGWTGDEKRYAAMLLRVDNSIKDIIALLQDYNIDDNTLIVFTSDNGVHDTGGHNPRIFQSFADMVGIKRDCWEGGIRVPTIVRYPTVIPSGKETDFNSGFWDWMSTFADLANAPIPARTDGVSLVPTLTEKGEQHDKGYVYIEYEESGSTPNWSVFGNKKNRKRNQMQVIKIGDYKGVRYNVKSHDNNFEIYNIANDRGETTNLASQMIELQNEMKNKVLQVRKVDADASRPYDDELIPSFPALNTVEGLNYSYYEGAYDYVPEFKLLTPTKQGHVNNIDFASKARESSFGYLFEGYLNIPKDGKYTFFLQSNSKAHIKLHDIHLLNDDVRFSGNEISTQLNLKSGAHPISIYYQQNEVGESGLSLKIQSDNIEKMLIPDAMFVRDLATQSSVKEEKALNNSVSIRTIDNEVNIRLTEKKGANNYTISLVNLMGATVIKQNYISHSGLNELSISSDEMPKGIYIVKIEKGPQNIFNQKIIK